MQPRGLLTVAKAGIHNPAHYDSDHFDESSIHKRKRVLCTALPNNMVSWVIPVLLLKGYQIMNGIGGAGVEGYHGNVDTTHVEIVNSIVAAKNKGGHHGYNLVHVDGKKVTVDLMVWHNTKKYWQRKKGIYEGSYTVK